MTLVPKNNFKMILKRCISNRILHLFITFGRELDHLMAKNAACMLLVKTHSRLGTRGLSRTTQLLKLGVGKSESCASLAHFI